MILLDPTNAMAFWQKGEIYEAMGLPERALRFYRVAHQMCPRAYANHHLTYVSARLEEKSSEVLILPYYLSKILGTLGSTRSKSREFRTVSPSVSSSGFMVFPDLEKKLKIERKHKDSGSLVKRTPLL